MAVMAASTESVADDSTRTRILEAALQCFKQLGIDKTSLIDVARTADLSRGTVYRYFSDRQSLIDATVERNTENYYGEAAEVMSRETTLVDQVGVFAEVFARNINNYRRNWLVNDDRELLRLLASDRDGGLRRMSTFIAPYVRAAKQRGEVAADLDETAASEWIARMFMSLTVMPGSTVFDASKPKTFRAFLERYTIDGLAPRPTGSRRPRR
jgi:AcrR family transcriptional regulator